MHNSSGHNYDLKINHSHHPKLITARLNHYLSKAGLNIRIMKTSAVRGDFNVRKAKLRKYLYRFAVRKRKERTMEIREDK